MAQRERMSVYSPLGYWTVPKSPMEEYPPFVPGIGRPAWLGPGGQPQPGQPMPQPMADPRAQQAIAQMQAAAIQQPMPGDMPVGAPMPQQAPQGFAPQSASMGDPTSPTGGRAPSQPLSPGGQMPTTTPDMIQSAMAPIGGSAGPGTEIYGETYPSQPTPPMAQQPPSAARTAMDEMLANRGDKAPWLALAAAGFGTAAGTSPHALTNIGQGGLKGIEMYDRMTDRTARDRLAAAGQLLQVERDDRNAGFKQQELGQGEQRIGIQRDELRSKDADRKQAREDAAAKLQFEREKESNQQPLRGAQTNLANANAEYVREQKGKGQDDARTSQIIQRVDNTAANIANAKHGKDPSMRDNDAWQETFEIERRRIAEANKIPLELLGLDAGAPPPSDPKKLKPNVVYQTPKGPLMWTGTGFVPPR